MALRNYINTSTEGSLSSSVGSGDTTFTLSGAGLSNIPSVPFYVRIDPDTATEEVCLVTAGSAVNLTVTRGYDGTTASSHSAGAKVRHVVVAEFFNKADAHVEASTNVHGLSGGAAVVGTTQSQTLSNKTINASVVDVAHSSSPAATQAFRVAADAATGRHGFVWDNTAGSTGKAFLAKVAGVDKTYIEGDGDLVVGGTSTTAGITNTGTLTQVGSVDVTGTMHATGAVDFDSTANVDGNATVGGTLAVTGTSTLTGNVTLPLPAAGTSARHTVNSRTGGINYVGKKQDGTTTFQVDETGRITISEKINMFDGASPGVARVSGTGIVPSPSTGMIVFDDSDGTIKRYNGTSWVTILYSGSVAAGGFARYFTNTVQSIPNVTETALQFHTAVTTSADVTASGTNNSVFTFNKSGVWEITTCGVFAAASGFREIAIQSSDLLTRYAAQNHIASASSAALSVSTVRGFNSGSAVSISAYQDSGGALNTLPVEAMHHVSFTWLRP